jgi:glycosyltransferase involved in cell wall biosynthesis
MVIALIAASILLELLLYSQLFWKLRLAFVVGLTLFLSASASILLQQHANWIAIGISICSILRLLNMFRIAQARMHQQYLRRATRRTSVCIGLLQLALLLLLSPYIPVDIQLTNLPIVTVAAQVLVAIALFSITIRNIWATRYRQAAKFYADKELPTVSLLIPARNETTDLEECLRSAIASDYPKLEIIVLDDCSQLKTSDIIKGFAHDGVRFVKGAEPNEHWLAKNQAYQRLAEEASGDLLLFCGVDVRFGSHAIKALVTEMLTRDKQMISILPHRLSGSLAGAFIQPMRYWWELSLPRKFFNRPPVLSTCWLITSMSLKKLGSFKAVNHSIIPEGFFARELIKTNDYSFIRANDTLDVQTHKSYREQRATAIRTRYPQLRRRPENVLVLVVLELTFLIGPFVGIIYGLVSNEAAVAILSSIAAIILILNHLIIVHLTSPANTIVALFNLPIEVITEIYIVLTSMIKYEFGTVDWKDRNVCIPVMHVVPRLPKG